MFLKHIPKIKKGIEKESLRTSLQGELSQLTHPVTLGSKLTHPYITTDYAEALLEIVTPTTHHFDTLFDHLISTQQFILMNIGKEYLWVNSMPCLLPNSQQITIADYGQSHAGKMKYIYRKGLMNRYGSYMQAISGIHYNLSFPPALLATLKNPDPYFSLIRNFKRHAWLLTYLFGASPAVDHTYAINLESSPLIALSEDTFYLPWSTSLRLSDIGYTSSLQEKIDIDYSGLDAYLNSLNEALNTPIQDYKQYQKGPEFDQQLNMNLLQTSSEYYSDIRPKCTAPSTLPFLQALSQQGTEYVEIRSIDLNPFEPIGITKQSCYFLDVLLTYCLLTHSAPFTKKEYSTISSNNKQVVYWGRKPDAMLTNLETNQSIPLKKYGLDLLENMRPIAQLFDDAHHTIHYEQVLNQQQEKIKNSELTPSADVLSALKKNGNSFFKTMSHLGKEHKKSLFMEPLSEQKYKQFQQLSQQSLAEQIDIEKNQIGDFETYRQRLLKPLD